jgi:hypothetical protein
VLKSNNDVSDFLVTNYIHLLVSIVHPAYAMTINRYCISVSLDDPRLRKFELDLWVEPEMRKLILSLLCEDWLTDNCAVVGCEEISGAVQWGEIQ